MFKAKKPTFSLTTSTQPQITSHPWSDNLPEKELSPEVKWHEDCASTIMDSGHLVLLVKKFVHILVEKDNSWELVHTITLRGDAWSAITVFSHGNRLAVLMQIYQPACSLIGVWELVGDTPKELYLKTYNNIGFDHISGQGHTITFCENGTILYSLQNGRWKIDLTADVITPTEFEIPKDTFVYRDQDHLIQLRFPARLYPNGQAISIQGCSGDDENVAVIWDFNTQEIIERLEPISKDIGHTAERGYRTIVDFLLSEKRFIWIRGFLMDWYDRETKKYERAVHIEPRDQPRGSVCTQTLFAVVMTFLFSTHND